MNVMILTKVCFAPSWKIHKQQMHLEITKTCPNFTINHADKDDEEKQTYGLSFVVLMNSDIMEIH